MVITPGFTYSALLHECQKLGDVNGSKSMGTHGTHPTAVCGCACIQKYEVATHAAIWGKRKRKFSDPNIWLLDHRQTETKEFMYEVDNLFLADIPM